MRIRVSVTLLLSVLTAACATHAGPSAGSPPPMLTMSRDLKSMTEGVLDDAARRTGLPRAELKVVSAESVTWPDGSIGCPQPGVMYTQALVPGYRIRIQAATEVLDYHAGRRGQPVLCPLGRSVEPAPDGPT